MRYLRAAFATVTPMRCLSLKSGMIRPQKQLRHPRGALLKKSLILRAEGVQLIALHIDESHDTSTVRQHRGDDLRACCSKRGQPARVFPYVSNVHDRPCRNGGPT